MSKNNIQIINELVTWDSPIGNSFQKELLNEKIDDQNVSKCSLNMNFYYSSWTRQLAD